MPDPTSHNERILIAGVPEGLVAEAVRRSDGTLPRDRRGRVKITEVTLMTTIERQVAAGERVPGVEDADVRWGISATRRWSGITGRFGDRATAVSHALCRAGVVAIRAAVTDDLRLGAYRSWEPTLEWVAEARRQSEAAADEARRWKNRAQSAADAIYDVESGLAATLRCARGSEPRLPVLVYAAEDLIAGVFHDGPRAFSQMHFGDSKARENVGDILTDAGADHDTLAALGIRRSPYIGLGGPLTVRGKSDHAVRLTDFDGPIRFRVDQPLTVTVDPASTTLLIIENLQAAEAICDRYRQMAVVWCAGQPADASLAMIYSVAAGLHVLIAPDADLGGVRIANRVAAALPTDVASVEVIDVGGESHPTGDAFGPGALDALRSVADGTAPAAHLARACLARGYRVEQEATIRKAVARRLGEQGI